MSQGTSLRRQLIQRVTIGLAAIGLVGVVVSFGLGAQYANLAYDQALFDDVATLAEGITVNDEALHVDLPPVAQRWLLANEGEKVRYRVIDLLSGRIVTGNGDLGEWSREHLVPAQPNFRDATIHGVPYRVAFELHRVDPTDVPVLVEVGETLGKRKRMTAQILLGSIAIIFSMIVVAVGLIWQGVGTALRPLRMLEEAAAQRSDTNLAALDVSSAPAEVRGLIRAINQMMARLSRSIESQRHFVANASHQLRTPIAGLCLQAQLLLRDQLSESARAGVAELEQSALRAAHVVEQLLTLSKAEAGEFVEKGSQVDLAEEARDAIGRYMQLAIENGVDVGYEGISGSAMLTGNRVLIDELLGNLIENGIKYGKRGGSVTVRTEMAQDALVLIVADDGPGLAEAAPQQVFRRFYRSDSSAGQGAGLGLAIVKEIADRHGASITVATTPGKGTRFEVRFPLAAGV